MSKYRVDQYKDLQEAVERMQQSWNEQPVAKPTVSPKDRIEQAPPQALPDPGAAVPNKFSQALDKNLQVGAMHPQFAKALSRSADGKSKVVPPTVKSEERADEWLVPFSRTARRRKLVKGKKTKRRLAVETDEERRDVDAEEHEREEIFEEGIDYVEYRARPAHERPMTHIESDGEDDGSEELLFDDEESEDDERNERAPVEFVPPQTIRPPALTRPVRSAPPTRPAPRARLRPEDGLVPGREVTRPDFKYEQGKTHYDNWVKQHSKGAQVEKGDGASYVDQDVTKTAVKPGGPSRR